MKLIELLKTKTASQIVKKLPDEKIWEMVQTPIESAMPEYIKKFLTACNKEFLRRPNKLHSICK